MQPSGNKQFKMRKHLNRFSSPKETFGWSPLYQAARRGAAEWALVLVFKLPAGKPASCMPMPTCLGQVPHSASVLQLLLKQTLAGGGDPSSAWVKCLLPGWATLGVLKSAAADESSLWMQAHAPLLCDFCALFHSNK